MSTECPSCGRNGSLLERRIDHVLTAFWLPLFTVHRWAALGLLSACNCLRPLADLHPACEAEACIGAVKGPPRPLFSRAHRRGQPYRSCTACGYDSRNFEGWEHLPGIGPDDARIGQGSGHGPQRASGRGDEGIGTGAGAHPSAPQLPLACHTCGHPVEQQFLYCPFCGSWLKHD